MNDIKCVLCDYLGMKSDILPNTDFFCCKKQNPCVYVCDVEKLYEDCPSPKELSAIKSILDRVTVVEKCVKELINERDESIRYENFDRLQAENARLKDRIDQLKRDFNTEANGYHETIHGLLGEKAIADKLRCENEKLKVEIETKKEHEDYSNRLIANLHDDIKRKDAELESLKKNQLSKAEIDYLQFRLSYGNGMSSEAINASILAKIQSMVGEK